LRLGFQFLGGRALNASVEVVWNPSEVRGELGLGDCC
jgi:hypothetical protein